MTNKVSNLIDVPSIRSYLEEAFTSSWQDIQDIERDLGWNEGYLDRMDILDSHYQPLARDLLNDLTGNISEQIPLTKIPNNKFKNSFDLKKYLTAFRDHLLLKNSSLKESFREYADRAKLKSVFDKHPPSPIVKAIEIIDQYVTSIDTSLLMDDFENVGNSVDELSNRALGLILLKLRDVVSILNSKRRKDAGIKRDGFVINDEYDVQDLLGALLNTCFNDIRYEEPMPSLGPSKTRCDLFIASHGIFIEVKTALKKSEKEIFNDFSVDIPNYLKDPKCKKLILFVYDPNKKIINRTQFDELKNIKFGATSAEVEIVFTL